MKYTIRLSNSIMGWMLVPSYRRAAGAEKVLSELYAQDWVSMPASERVFMKGESLANVIDHIKEVCNSCGISVSFCGSKTLPTINLWWTPKEVQKVKSVNVDLKWSCWSVDRSLWDELASGVWESMEQAFMGGAPVVVNTGPRKEIRYGTIAVSKGRASGYFSSEWDSLEELADTLGVSCNEAFCETIPMSSHLMEPGPRWSGRSRFDKTLVRVP